MNRLYVLYNFYNELNISILLRLLGVESHKISNPVCESSPVNKVGNLNDQVVYHYNGLV